MQFRLSHLLFCVLLIAVLLGFRTVWVTLETPIYAASGPLFICCLLASWAVWRQHRLVRVVGLTYALALAACGVLMVEIVAGSQATAFVPTAWRETGLNVKSLLVVSTSITLIATVIGFIGINAATKLLSAREGVAASVILLLVGSLVTWSLLATGPLISDTTASRVEQGMTRQQVEAIVGSANKSGSSPSERTYYWDAYQHLGRRYVSLKVRYNEADIVQSVERGGFWAGNEWLLYW